MKSAVLVMMLCAPGWVCAQTKKPGFLSFTWTFPAVQAKSPFSSTLINSDSLRVETVDSISPGGGGGELMFAFAKWVFIVGAQPPSTWIGERPFRLRYTALDQNQVVTTTDSVEAHFYHASFFMGVGYRFQIDNPNFDISVAPYWQKQTGRFIIHDALYAEYERQQDLSSEERNDLPDSVRLKLNDLTQERTRDYSIGLRLNFSYGATYKGVGLIVFLTPRIQYSYLTVKEPLNNGPRSESQNGWSYGGTVGVGLLFGNLPLGKRAKAKQQETRN